MGTLIRFELRKILGNRAGMAACILTLLLLVALSVLNLATLTTRDLETGEVVTGFEAQASVRRIAESHAGVLDEEHIAKDAATFDRAEQLSKETPDVYDLPNEEVISAYGLKLWQDTIGVVGQRYYMEIVGTIDSTNPRTLNLQEGAEARVDGALQNDFAGYFPYTDAEKAYWKDKASQISWPVTYGYADGWKNATDWSSFLGLAIIAACVALSGTYAGEYQERTAAVVLPTMRGKRSLPVAKVIAAGIFVTIYWWICAATTLGINLAVCGANGADLPIQIVSFDNPYPLTMSQETLLVLLLGYLVALGMAAFTLLLSARMHSTMPVAIIPMALTFLGMFALFITPLTKIAALTPLSGLNYVFTRMLSYKLGPVVADLPTVLAVLYAVIAVAFTPLAMQVFKQHQVA